MIASAKQDMAMPRQGAAREPPGREEQQRGAHTWLVRLGVFLQPRHKLVKLLLPLFALLRALPEQLRVISRPQLVLARREVVRKGRSAHTDGGAAVLLASVPKSAIQRHRHAPDKTAHRLAVGALRRKTYPTSTFVHSFQLIAFLGPMVAVALFLPARRN